MDKACNCCRKHDEGTAQDSSLVGTFSICTQSARLFYFVLVLLNINIEKISERCTDFLLLILGTSTVAKNLW